MILESHTNIIKQIPFLLFQINIDFFYYQIPQFHPTKKAPTFL